MFTRSHRPRLLLLCLFMLIASLPQQTQAAVTQERISQAELTLTRVSELLDEALRGGAGSSALSALWRDAQRQRETAQECISEQESRLLGVQADLSLIGEKSANESLEVLSHRSHLKERKQEVSRQLERCRLILLRSEELSEHALTLRDSGLTRYLSVQREPIWSVMADGAIQLPHTVMEIFDFIAQRSGWEQLANHQRIMLLFIGLFGLALGSIGRSWVAPKLGLPEIGVASTPWLSYALRFCLARRLPLLGGMGLLGLYLLIIFPLSPLPFLLQLLLALGGLLISSGLTRALLGPCGDLRSNPLLPVLSVPRLRRLIYPLLWLLFVSYLLFHSGLKQGLESDTYQLLRAIIVPLLIINLLLLIWQCGTVLPVLVSTRRRLVLSLLIASIIFIEWLGYLNLSLYLLGGAVGTLLAFSATLFLLHLFDDTLGGLDEGRHPWQHRLRNQMGLEVGRRFPNRFALRVVTFLLAWGAFGYSLLLVWGLSGQGSTLIFSYLVDGFALGDLTIVPSRLLTALVVLLFISGMTRSFQRHLESGWLRYTSLDRGAREATITLSGYLGNGIALLVALTVAGVQFGHLAIIAGALSVGIGFGLQNVVNNFVSGLILLFERPVRAGDWIVVGNTEGYVKQISIRSTVIETFDRADVIVPNSELISQQVTNWMLRDQFGRVKVPVGVAYGSDLQKVKSILTELAHAHPLVIIDGTLPAPYVLFIGFGDSSLDFQLRCYISEVDSRMTVLSDLNFAIDEAFREAGIEIPYPQRDLHLRSLPGGF